MAEKVQKVPLSLLDILGTKSLGRTPNLIGDEVRAVLEIGELYLADRLETLSENTAALSVAGQGGAGIIVPTGEVWIVKQQSAQIFGASAAAGVLQCHLQWRGDSLGTTPPQNYAMSDRETGTATTDLVSTSWKWDRPRVCLSDCTFRALLSVTPGGGITVSLFHSVSFYRLQV